MNPGPYPAIEAHSSGMLPVGGGHEIYWEEVGHPEGTPALYRTADPAAAAVPATGAASIRAPGAPC